MFWFIHGKKHSISMLTVVAAVLLSCLFLCACGNKPDEKSDMSGRSDEKYVYYMNKEETRLDRVAYDEDNYECYGNEIERYIAALGDVPSKAGLKNVLGVNTQLINYELKDGQLILDFDENYAYLQRNCEVLFRASIVKTLCQSESVSSIVFLVEGNSLTDLRGEPYGTMTAESFIDNTSDGMDSYERTELTLYYANGDGTRLLTEKRDVVYSSNIAIEKIVVDELLKGPSERGLHPTLSSDRRINSVSVKDGTCYVDLSELIVDTTGGVDELVSIYSIVNSLTENSSVNKVQILIDGKTDRTYRDGVSLDQMFSRNLELVGQ